MNTDTFYRPATLLIQAVLFFLLPTLAIGQTDVWFGTSGSKHGSKGIYHATLDSKTGTLSKATLAFEIESPGFLTMHPTKDLLYAVCETEAGFCVAGFQIETGGKLTLLSSQPTGDGKSAHLSIHPSGKMLITAQYRAGSTAVFPLDENGKIGFRSQLHKQGPGSGATEKQKESHAHWTGFDAAGRFAFVPDLGMDGVVIYKVNQENNRLIKHGFAKCPRGSGPRHMKFSGEYAYVLNEFALTVASFKYDGKGAFTPVATVQALTDEQKSKELFNSASEIRIHPTQKFAYSANRGHDSITVYKIEDAGKLSVVEVEPIRGSIPRNFNIDPTGKWLLAAGADSNSVAVFRIDSETGELTYLTGQNVYVPSPICVLFAK